MRSRIRQPLFLSAILLASQSAVAGEMGETAFMRLDTNRDGFIDASDLAAMRQRMFARLDRDHDGFLSQAELTPPAPSSHPTPTAIAWPDPDKDGRVSQAEFMGQEPALIVRGDRDGDKRLSTLEFRELIAARR